MKQNQTFFHGTYLNLTSYIFLSKYIRVFQRFSKSGFISFMTKVNPNNRNETKSDIFPRDVLKSDIIFIGRKILKYFNDFYNFYFSIGTFQSHCKSEHNHIKWNKVKRDMWKSDSIFLIYKVVNYWNDFWNLFLDKVYH